MSHLAACLSARSAGRRRCAIHANARRQEPVRRGHTQPAPTIPEPEGGPVQDGVVRLAELTGPWQRVGHDDVPQTYCGFRYPAAVIEHAVWLHHCFRLSLRDVETVLSARGVVVSDESIREWACAFTDSSRVR